MIRNAETQNQNHGPVPSETRHWTETNSLTLIALFGVTASIAAAIRIIYIIGHDLWNDEIFTADAVTSSLPTMIDMLQRDIHPPLHYAFLKGVFWTLGGLGSVGGLRLVNALFWLIVAGAALLFYSRRVDRNSALPALVGFIFVGLAPAQAYLGAEFRMYGMLMSAGIVCAVGAATLIRSEQARQWWMAVTIGLAFGVLATTHYAGSLLAVSIFVTLVGINWVRNRELSYAAWLCVGVLAIVLPSMPVIVHSALDELNYTTAFGESRHFVKASGGIVAAVLLVALLIRMVIARSTYRIPTLGLVTILATSFYVVVLFLFGILSDTNLFTFGVTATVVTLAALAGAHVLSSIQSPSMWSLIVGFLVIGFGAVSVAAIHQPWEFEPNRVSTVDGFRDVLLTDSLLGVDSGASVGVLHIDWQRNNVYFVDQIKEQLPRSTIEGLNFGELPEASPILANVLAELCSSNGSVFVVSRASSERLDLEMLVPDGTSIAPVGRGVLQVCVDDQ